MRHRVELHATSSLGAVAGQPLCWGYHGAFCPWIAEAFTRILKEERSRVAFVPTVVYFFLKAVITMKGICLRIARYGFDASRKIHCWGMEKPSVSFTEILRLNTFKQKQQKLSPHWMIASLGNTLRGLRSARWKETSFAAGESVVCFPSSPCVPTLINRAGLWQGGGESKTPERSAFPPLCLLILKAAVEATQGFDDCKISPMVLWWFSYLPVFLLFSFSASKPGF